MYNGVGSTIMQVPTGTPNIEVVGSVSTTELKLNNSDQMDFSALRDFSNIRILNLRLLIQRII